MKKLIAFCLALWIVLCIVLLFACCASQKKDFFYLDEQNNCRAICHKCHLLYTCGHYEAHKHYCREPELPWQIVGTATDSVSPKIYIFQSKNETIYLDWEKKNGRVFRVDSLGNKIDVPIIKNKNK